MTRTSPLALAILLGTLSLAQAQSCEGNFSTEGVPLVTALNYKSWQAFPKVDPARALDNLHRAVLAEGFTGVKVDKATGALTAQQETSGSGRPQTLRVVVRKSGSGSRVDVVFMVQPGQVAPEAATRSAICRIVDAAPGV